jgi:RNA polymerase sigma-70 factor (ECF subfamily)
MSGKFESWVQAYQDDAWSLARYMLRDTAAAEDAVQDAFIKLWQQKRPLESGQVRPWLMRVVRNNCIDRLRGRRNLQPVADLALQDDPGVTVEQTEIRRRVSNAISRLSEPYRSLIVLRDLLQHSYGEVTEVTGLNLNQVRVYLHRARAQLRELLLESDR